MRARRGVAAEHLERRKQRRRVLAAADGYADGLEHLAGLDSQRAGGGAQRLFQRIVRELGGSQHLAAALQAPQRHGRIAFLRDQLGAVIRRQLRRQRRNRPRSARRAVT